METMNSNDEKQEEVQQDVAEAYPSRLAIRSVSTSHHWRLLPPGVSMNTIPMIMITQANVKEDDDEEDDDDEEENDDGEADDDGRVPSVDSPAWQRNENKYSNIVIE